MTPLVLLQSILISAQASPTNHSAQAGEFANLANPTDGQTPSVLSTWSDMQRAAPAPKGASSVSASGKVAHGFGLALPPALVMPSIGFGYEQGASAHSYLGRGWRLTAGLTVRRPTGPSRLAYFSTDEGDIGDGALDVLVVSGDGLDGLLYQMPGGWEWESLSPSAVHLSEKPNGNLLIRSGGRTWELAEVVANVYRTIRTADRSNNRVDYTWVGNQLMQVLYGGQGTGTGNPGNHVVYVDFVYRDAAHVSFSSADGDLEMIDQRLDRVQISTSPTGQPQKPQLAYTFEYSVAGDTFSEDEVLLQVRQADNFFLVNDRLVQRFDYSELDLTPFDFHPGTQPRWIGQSGTFRGKSDKTAVNSSRVRFEDWSHDGLPDVVEADGDVNVNPMVRGWTDPLPEVSYYELPPLSDDTASPGHGIQPDSGLFQTESLDETEVRIHTDWNRGTVEGRNATFTTLHWADVNQDGWLDRIRAVEVDLQTLLDDTITAVEPTGPHGPFGFAWEVCYADTAIGGGSWDFDCHNVLAPYLTPRIGFQVARPYAAIDHSDDYEASDMAVQLMDMDHDGWLDIVAHDGNDVVYYPMLGTSAAPGARRALGWELTSPIPVHGLDWMDGSRGTSRVKNLVDTDSIQVETEAETTVPAVYASEELVTLRDLNGDGRLDRITVEGFDTSGSWKVYFAEGDGFATAPVTWPAPRGYLGRSDEGLPTAIVSSIPFCAGEFPPGTGLDEVPLPEMAGLAEALPRWDPGDIVQSEDLCSQESPCNWVDHPMCTDANFLSTTIFELCTPHAYIPQGTDGVFEDLWADLNEATLADDSWRGLDGSFDDVTVGRPRVVYAGLIDIDADGRVDFFDGLAGTWFRNQGDGFEGTGRALPSWWPTRSVKIDEQNNTATAHVLEVSNSAQYVISMAHCVVDDTYDAEHIVGSDSITDTKLRVMDLNGDGLLDFVSNEDPSIRPGGITYAGAFEPQEAPGLLKRVTNNTLLEVDFAYQSSVEVYPHGHAEQTVPLMGESLGADMLVASMAVSDPFQPRVDPVPFASEEVATWTRYYTYDTPICRNGRCWGFDSVLFEDELLQREPGGNGSGPALWSYTETLRSRGGPLGPRQTDVYIGDGELGANTDRYHTNTSYNVFITSPAPKRVGWPQRLLQEEKRLFNGTSTSRYTRLEHDLDLNGNVLSVDFDRVDASGAVLDEAESVRQETTWVGDSYGVLWVPEEQWVYGGVGQPLVEHATYAYDGGGVGDAPTKGLLTSQNLASGPAGNLDSEWIGWSFVRDARGQVEVATLPNGLTTTRYWSLFGGVMWDEETVSGDFGSFTRLQQVDELGRVTVETGPNGNGTETVYDAYGRPIESYRFGSNAGLAATPFLMAEVEYVDAREELAGSYPARVHSTSHNYALDGSAESQAHTYELLDAHGRAAVTLSSNEAAGFRVSGVRRGVLDEEATTWSDVRAGSVLSELDTWWDLSTIPGPVVTHLTAYGEFDGLGEVQRAWTLDAGEVEHSYPEPGMHGTHMYFVEADTCSREESKLLVSDSRGRLVRVEEGYGAWALNGDVTGEYTYDANGRVASFVNGVGDVLAYHYDGVGRLRDVEAARDGGTLSPWVSYGYDEPIPTPTAMDMTGLSTMSWVYDDLGRTVSQTASGRVAGVDEATTWLWDGQWKGAVDSVSFPTHHGMATLSYAYDEHTGTYDYDQEGWLTSETLSLPDAAGGSTDYTFAYHHDPQGRVIRAEWPTGGVPLAVETSYFPNGQAKSHAVLHGMPGGPLAKSLMFDLTYDNWGNLSEWSTNPASDWNAPDEAMGLITYASPRKVEHLLWDIEGSQRSVLYDHCGDDAVLLSRIYDNGSAPDESFTYHYDVFNRIEEVEHSTLGSIEAYTYDLANNPLSSRVGATAPVHAYDYAPPGVVVGSVGFHRAKKAAGDDVTYDLAQRVDGRSRGGLSRGFVYDGQSRVVQGTLTNGAATSTRDFWYAPGNGVVEEVGDGAMAGVTRRFKGFRSIDGVVHLTVLPWLSLRNGQAVYTLDEPDGRAAMTLDVNGVALSERYISAYGEELFSSGGDWPLHGLHGAEPDEQLEVAHFGARHMALRGGQWLQREPLLRLGVPFDAAQTPRHFSGAYAGANPINWHDSTGKYPGLALDAIHFYVEMHVASYDAEYQSDPTIADNRPVRHAGYLALAIALTLQEEMPGETMIITGRMGLRPRVRAPRVRVPKVRTPKAGLFENKFPEHAVGPPVQTFSAQQASRPSFNRKLNYVVTEGGDLRLGRITNDVGGGHIDLAQGAPVLAAGEVKILGGKIRTIDNSSGHYLPSGKGAQAAAENAFQNAGFNTAGTYVEKVWNGSAWVAK